MSTSTALDAARSELQAVLRAGAADDGAMVRLLDRLLQLAGELRASDLHFEPYEGIYRIRIRIDGQLQECLAPPLALRDRLVSRIKVLSKLDIAEKRLPQDGRLRLSPPGQPAMDFRVSSLPTLHGEKLVLRLIDAAPAQMSFDALGYDSAQQATLLQALARPHGMILVTGPTGSGKTLSMYSCLQWLNRPGLNICTAEDPAEIMLPGINQVSINEKAGLDFATALRAFLRQDPDVIMVGEIRDLETADMALKALATPEVNVCTIEDPIEMVESSFNQMQVQSAIDLNFAEGLRALMRQDPDIIMVGEIRDLETAEMAIQAALTGHLVLSTLHTNDAPSAITRLLELGVPHYLLKATLLGVMAQRLVRTLCPHCKQPTVLDADDWQTLTRPWNAPLPTHAQRAVGCLECRDTGYRGRAGVYEIMLMNDAIKPLITAADTDLVALRRAAFKDGMRSLRLSGAQKIAAGLTTIDEVLRVTPQSEQR